MENFQKLEQIFGKRENILSDNHEILGKTRNDSSETHKENSLKNYLGRRSLFKDFKEEKT